MHDRDWCPVIYYPSSFFWYYCERVSHAGISMTMPRAARVYIRLPNTPSLPQLEDLLPSNGNCIGRPRVVSNNNTNIGNNEASGWDPLWILFHDDYYTNPGMRYIHTHTHIRYAASIRTSEIFLLWVRSTSKGVATESATVIDLQGCVRNWLLYRSSPLARYTFSPLNSQISEHRVRKHITSQTNYLHHRLIII